MDDRNHVTATKMEDTQSSTHKGDHHRVTVFLKVENAAQHSMSGAQTHALAFVEDVAFLFSHGFTPVAFRNCKKSKNISRASRLKLPSLYRAQSFCLIRRSMWLAA